MIRNQNNQQPWNLSILVKFLAIPAVLTILAYLGKNLWEMSNTNKDIKAFNKLAGRISANCHFPIEHPSNELERCSNFKGLVELHYDPDVVCDGENGATGTEVKEYAHALVMDQVFHRKIEEQCNLEGVDYFGIFRSRKIPGEPAYCREFRDLWNKAGDGPVGSAQRNKASETLTTFLQKHHLTKIDQHCDVSSTTYAIHR